MDVITRSRAKDQVVEPAFATQVQLRQLSSNGAREADCKILRNKV